MRRSLRTGRLSALLLLFPSLLLAAARTASEGSRAPSFTAPRLDGRGSLSLDAYRGRVVYLDFWASWCGPCAISLPALEGLRKEFPAADFQVVAVNVDHDPDAARRFLAKRPVGYPSVTDPEGQIPESFGLETMPTAYLIDRSGVIRYVHRGFRRGDVDELRQRIRSLVGAKRARP